MNERIKPLLNWTVVLCIAGILLLFILFPQIFGAVSPYVQKLGYMLSNPSMILLEFTTQSAISRFGGGSGMEGFSFALIPGLTGAVIIFGVVPALLVYGYKKSETLNGKLRPAAWHVGMGIALIAIGIGFYSSVSFFEFKSDVVASAERQHAMDRLQFELIDLYYDASAKAFLPHERGGGNGHFTNFLTADGSTRTIQLSDLARYKPDGPFEIVISENVSDSTIIMTGVSDLEGNDPDFQNSDGRTGRIQMTLTMNPYEDEKLKRLNIKRENEWLYAGIE